MAKDKQRVIKDTEDIIKLLTDTSHVDSEITKIEDEMVLITELVNKLVKENSKTDISLEEYNRKYEELTLRYERLQIKQDELLRLRSERQGQALKIKSFVSSLKQTDNHLNDWNANIWMLLVDSAIVHRNSNITFKFMNGEELLLH